MTEDILKQLNSEIGDDEIRPETATILLQKFGLSAPLLTPSELFLIEKDDRKYGRI